MNIDKHTLALVGYPINHSLSPLFQNEALQLLNLDYHYQSISIEPNIFLTEFPSLLSNKIAGMNITMPYKKAVIPFLDQISDHSILTGSVNTIYRFDHCYYGTSTDGIGFFKSLFYKFPLVKFNQWVKAEREPEFIGQHLFIFTTMRFILEILAALAVIFSPLDILAFLGGLLTLPMASLVERLVGLIKE